MDWVHLDAVDAVDGVWVMWDRRVVEMVDCECGGFSIT